MAYNPNISYEFTDSEGNKFWSKGDNGYVWQAIENGVPLSIDENGDWYVTPYLEAEGDTITANIPEWFKGTEEYNLWQTVASQLPTAALNNERMEALGDYLTSLGNQGALRYSLKSDANSFNITDQNEINRYVQTLVGMASEGQGGGNYQFTLGDTTYDSVADFARQYSQLNKEQLSKAVTEIYDNMAAGADGTFQGTQQELLDWVLAGKILNYVDDNYTNFGKNKEFQDLLQSSGVQKFQRGITNAFQNFTSNSIFGVPARLFYGVASAIKGDGFDMRIENMYQKNLNRYWGYGANLEGNEAADQVGQWGGTVANLAVTVTLARVGSAAVARSAATTPGSFLAKAAAFQGTLPGSIAFDFFLNDLPVDTVLFINDIVANNGDVGKAWYDPTNTQPFFGIPFIGRLGPDAPAGYAMNLAGDFTVDVALAILQVTNNTVTKVLDYTTGGAITRMKEKVALGNLKLQKALSDLPVLGTGWQKVVNHFMGPENANFIREARKAAIAEGSMTPYIKAQNALTLSNHAGMEAVSPIYKKLDEKNGISQTIKKFQKNAREYGGYGETKVEWKTTEAGVEKNFSQNVPDKLPRKVKQGLLDIERLSELKGERGSLGGLVGGGGSSSEIAALEKRVAALPQDVKDFAERFSQMNKDVEWMRVELGIKDEDWVKRLQDDPRWENYMTRQALVPGVGKSLGTNPPEGKILTAKRKGYYSDTYIDPTEALGMKVEAIGRAYAYNERAKLLASFQLAQGNVIAGKGGVEIAKKLADVKGQIKEGTDYRKNIDYDGTIGRVNSDVNKINGAFREVNDLLNLPQEINIKSVYDASQSPVIRGVVNDFSTGKITLSEEAKQMSGLTDADIASVVQNTYSYKQDIIKGKAQKSGAGTGYNKEWVPGATLDRGGGGARDAIKVQGTSYTVGDVRIATRDHLENVLKENGIEGVELVDLDAHGSRVRGTARPDSDLDVVVEYRGDFKEDALFNILNDPENKLTIDGVEVDINPIRAEETGNLQDYMVRSDEYDQEIFKKIDMEREAGKTEGTPEVNIPDNVKPEDAATGTRNITAGVTQDGRAFEYEIQDGVIVSMKEITDPEGLADAINKLGGIYHTTAKTIDNIGVENAKAVNRAILYYRDNLPGLPVGPTFRMATNAKEGVLGWIPTPGFMENQGEYNFKLVNGHVEAETYPVYMATNFFQKGKEDFLQKANEQMVRQGDSPKNSAAPENTVIHELGHNMMARLVICEVNRKIDEGLIKIPEGASAEEINKIVKEQWESTHELLVKRAFEKHGVPFSDAEWKRQAKTISNYAGSGDYRDRIWRYETYSEAAVDHWANGADSSPFTLWVLDEIKEMGERFSVTADPKTVFIKNGMDLPKTLFSDDGQYKFPKNVKTDKQKAKWLDEWRQKNPYIKKSGAFTEDDYRKANLWDTYFKKEVYAYNADSKSAMPDVLTEKNGVFLENIYETASVKMIEKIREAGIEGFDSDLATMVISKNSGDITVAMDEFIIGRVDIAAKEIAEKMPGGATEENLNRARMTLWSDSNIQNDFVRMLSTLSPSADLPSIQSKIGELFDTQAKGLATYDALPVELKHLAEEKRRLVDKLYKENNYAKKVGKKADEALTDYRGEVTQVIHYKEGGEDVYIVVKDPVVASILKKPNNYKESGITVEAMTHAANFVSRAYRIGTTGMNPVAFVRNILRDPIQAMGSAGFNPLNMNLSPEVFYHTLRQFGLDDRTIDIVSQKLHTWASSGTLTSEMRNYGIYHPNSVGYRNRVEKAARKLDKALEWKIIRAGEAPLEAWESMFRNQIAEQAFIKNYRRTKDVDKALSNAMFVSSNATTNFSHSVGMFKRATSTVPYLSSAINGTRSFWVLFNADPVGMTMRMVGGFMVPAMAVTAWNLADEERRKTYLSLPEWYRDSHIVLVGLDGKIIALPLPEELDQYYGTIRRLVEYSEEATPYSISTILAKGAFGFLPSDFDGFVNNQGEFDFWRGFSQFGSGLLPQAFTTLYELVAKEDLYTGQDLSAYDWLNTVINAGSNMFGTVWKQVANDIGLLAGASEKTLVGKSTADTLARDLFGMGFDEATSQFMNLVGTRGKINPDGSEVKSTGLFAENEKLQKQIEALNRDIAVADDEEKVKLEQQKKHLIDSFSLRVKNLTNNYLNLYSLTGGLEEWQKKKLVEVLTLGMSSSSAESSTYQYQDTTSAYLNERSLAQERLVEQGLPAGPSLESLGYGSSIDMQAALNRFYGVTKQATADYKNALEETKLKDIRDEFYGVMQKIYDYADENKVPVDYDIIEKIQARYLQSVDAVLVPIINQYGINILNNNDFIDAVRRQVNGMIPSDDWRQSVRNAKKFLSTKDFPTATVDVKKWLKNRYASGMRDRGLQSDPEVTEKLEEIKADINAGKNGVAKGKIESLMKGVKKSNYYISAIDFQTLSELNDMLK